MDYIFDHYSLSSFRKVNLSVHKRHCQGRVSVTEELYCLPVGRETHSKGVTS
jgi:hypothetical protein